MALGRDIGPASDMFSLGGVLVFAATGLPPFYGGMTTMVLERIVTQPPDLSRVPAELRPLIEWCLDKEPARRPAPRDLLGRLDDASLWDDWLPQPLLAGLRGASGRGATIAPAAPRHDDTRPLSGSRAGSRSHLPARTGGACGYSRPAATCAGICRARR